MEELLLQEIRGLREELREFRADVTTWRQETGERVATIETQIQPAILGNGQPSRLATVESRVTDLEKERWRLAGAFATSSIVVTILVEFLRGKLWGR